MPLGVLLLVGISPASATGERSANLPVATFDFEDTPLIDILKLCAGNEGAQLDTDRVPLAILATPVSITYQGTQNGFLNQLGRKPACNSH